MIILVVIVLLIARIKRKMAMIIIIIVSYSYNYNDTDNKGSWGMPRAGLGGIRGTRSTTGILEGTEYGSRKGNFETIPVDFHASKQIACGHLRNPTPKTLNP